MEKEEKKKSQANCWTKMLVAVMNDNSFWTENDKYMT